MKKIIGGLPALVVTMVLFTALMSLVGTILIVPPLWAQQSGWVPTANLNQARAGHTATRLADGKILIVGGENQGGVVAQSEIFDPGSGTFSPGAALIVPRSDHSATLLPDGRVLVIGGRDQIGLLTSTEIFDPATNSFSPGPNLLKVARAGHSATVLADGRILFAGGDGGSAEIYDPVAQSFALLSSNMTSSRVLHGAVLLQDGKVLIAGGIAPDNTLLDIAEIFDPQTMSFRATVEPMQTARIIPTLSVLPDGKVQVIGGDAAFSMEIFDPAGENFNGLASLPPTEELLSATLSTQSRAALITTAIAQNPYCVTCTTADFLKLLDRTDHSLTEIPQFNQALVAGGVDSAGQVLTSAYVLKSSPASVTTQQVDYPPGATVVIIGAGFQPGETVSMIIHEMPDAYPDFTLTSVADETGNFTNTDFSPGTIDLGRTFILTAIGQSSGFTAQTTFTDDKGVMIAFAGTGSGTVASTSNPTQSNQLNCTSTDGTGSGTCSVNFGNNAALTLTATVVSGSTIGTWNVPSGYTINSGCASGNTTCNFTMNNTAQTVTVTFNVACTAPSITTNPSNQTVTYGQNASFSAAANGNPTPTVQWQVSTNGGSTWANVSGATSTTLTLTKPLVSQSLNQYRAVFTNDCGGTKTATSNAATLTVNPKAVTVTPNAGQSKVYGAADPTFTYTNSPALESGDSFTGALGRAAGNNVGTYAYTLGTLSAGSNYTLSLGGSNTFAITPKPLTITANNRTKTYGDTVTFLGTEFTTSGLVAPDTVTSVTLTSAGAAASATVAGSPYPIVSSAAVGTGLGNYTISYVNGSLTVTPKTLTITADNKGPVQYSDPLPLPFTATYSGFANGEGSGSLTGTLSCTSTATVINGNIDSGESPDPYPITCSGQSSSNYNISYVAGTLTVIKEQAYVEYTGDLWVSTAGPTITTAPVRLSAVVTQENDGNPGDLSRARVRFELFKYSNNSGVPNILVGNIPVDAAGNAMTIKTVPVDPDPYTVKAKIEPSNQFWTSNGGNGGAAETVVLTVAIGSTDRRVTGGGWIPDPSSTNGKGNFGFTVNYQKTGRPKGNSIYLFRGLDGFNYLVKSNSWEGGGLSFNVNNDPTRASFSGKCSVQKIDPVTGVTAASWGNYSFTVDIRDGDLEKIRKTDRYAITILDNNGNVWRQVGSPASPIQLGGGQLVVHSK